MRSAAGLSEGAPPGPDVTAELRRRVRSSAQTFSGAAGRHVVFTPREGGQK